MKGFKYVLIFCLICLLVLVTTFAAVSGPALLEWSKQ